MATKKATVSFAESKTCENLLKSFAGESQARMRYTYYAKKAEKEGFLQIRDIFLETAENEKEHAKLFYNHLLANGMNEKMVVIKADYPVALSMETVKNLEYAANGEKEEYTILYPEFAKIAEEEGYKEIATSYRMVSTVEKRHHERYMKLCENVKTGNVFKKGEIVSWICMNCGHIHEGKTAPKECPTCHHEQKYFAVWTENY